MSHRNSDLQVSLAALGWKQTDLGQRLGVHRNTVSIWAKTGVPSYVQAYLRLMIGLKGLTQ